MLLLLALHVGGDVVERDGGQGRRELAEEAHIVNVAIAEKKEYAVGVSVFGCG